MLLSWDNYQFYKNHDGNQYFLNLAMIRAKAQEANLPSSTSSRPQLGAQCRVPVPDEMRYLVYTTSPTAHKASATTSIRP